jgi:hypothetical protein
MRVGCCAGTPSPPLKYDLSRKSLKAGWLGAEVFPGVSCKVVISGGLGVRYDFLKDLARFAMPGWSSEVAV